MKTKLPYTQALPIAQTLVSRFTPHCARVEIAGSIRRQKAEVGDVEIIAIPAPSLYTYLDKLLADGKIAHKTPKRWGEKYRAFVMTLSGGALVPVDVFLCSVDTFGVNKMIRTGSSDFSRWMVTQKAKHGWCPNELTVKEARVIDNTTGEILDTPEEEDVFRLWGMESVPPNLRTDEWRPKGQRHPSQTPLTAPVNPQPAFSMPEPEAQQEPQRTLPFVRNVPQPERWLHAIQSIERWQAAKKKFGKEHVAARDCVAAWLGGKDFPVLELQSQIQQLDCSLWYLLHEMG